MRAVVFLVVVSGLFSCNEDPSGIGSGFFQDGSVNMVTVDTITIHTSTVTFDSLVTSDATRLLIGSHSDDELGVVSSSTFFQIAPESSFLLDKAFTSYTRVELRLAYDGYSYYDTTSAITFNAHRITEELETDDLYFYNTSSFGYDPVPMGSISFTPRPNTGDTLVMPISDDFGKEIVRLAQASAVEVMYTSEFVHYFQGLAVIPVAGNGAIVGFSTAAELRVYYMDKSHTPGKEKYLKMVTTSELIRFNQVLCDRSGTALSGLVSQQEHFNSSRTDRRSYIQSGAGLGMRVEMPYLRDMLRENEDLTIVGAELEIAPARENSGRNAGLPRQLIMLAVNYKNEVLGSYEAAAQLKEDVYLGRDTHYEVNVRDFVTQQLATAEFNQNALLFTFPDSTFRSSVTRLYAGDQLNEREMKLRIYCLTFSK
jgi:hypothetical protein